MIKLPPLPMHPEPHTYIWSQREIDAIRTSQREAMRAALEAAAKVCDAEADDADSKKRKPFLTLSGATLYDGMRGGATNCASAIRALRIEGEAP
jgi:hypothetical protein